MSRASWPKPDEIRRSNRKTLALEIRPDGGLLVRAPQRMPMSSIERFIREKADWIEKKQQQVRSRPHAAVLCVEDGAVWPLYGEQVTLRLMDVNAAILDASAATLYLPRTAPAQVFERYLREQTRQVCTKIAERLMPVMGVAIRSLRVTGASSRWGSCSASGNVNFSWHLILCPPAVVEYVVVHELCHRRHMDHSAAFWQMVKMYCPGYAECRRWLRENRALTEAGEAFSTKNRKK